MKKNEIIISEVLAQAMDALIRWCIHANMHTIFSAKEKTVNFKKSKVKKKDEMFTIRV